jgi:hypothetical protein
MRVVTIEPIVEWYDADDPIDLAAIRFHTARNYWRGFPAKLAALERDGRVEVLARKRSYFGSLYIEGYSQLIWRPVDAQTEAGGPRAMARGPEKNSSPRGGAASRP